MGVSVLIYVIYRLLFLTVRVREVNRPKIMVDSLTQGIPLVYAHWHGHEWLLFHVWRTRPMAVLASLSHQGQRMSWFMDWMGFRVFRGSSSKGGALGLRQLVRAVREGCSTSLAVDGPRGPRHVVKSGVVQLAKLTQSPLIPVVATCDRAWIFKKSWNQALLPKPFSHVTIMYGPPITLGDHDEKTRGFLEQQMLLMTEHINVI